MIDWKEAPEGTTHLFVRQGEKWWIKRIGDRYHWWRVGARAPEWVGAKHPRGGGDFLALPPESLYRFGSQEPLVALELFNGVNPFEIVPDQPKPQRKVGWW